MRERYALVVDVALRAVTVSMLVAVALVALAWLVSR